MCLCVFACDRKSENQMKREVLKGRIVQKQRREINERVCFWECGIERKR